MHTLPIGMENQIFNLMFLPKGREAMMLKVLNLLQENLSIQCL